MLKLATMLLLLSVFTPAFANEFESKLKMNLPNTIISTYKNSREKKGLYPMHCPQCHNSNFYLTSSQLGSLEKYALNKTFNRESDISRLERLENLAFGASQNGDLISRYANVEHAILSRPPYKTKSSFLGALTNYLTGIPTGFTPSIGNSFYNSRMMSPAGLGFSHFGGNFYPYPSYMNQNFEQYSTGPFSSGWGMSNQNYGTGSSVRILE